VVGTDGWGDALGDVHRLATDVRFLGFVPSNDLPACYVSATVFAYPSEWEGFGLPVAEAMAQGVPVVTSRGTSTEEVAGGAAVLVDPGDTDDIARGITAALAPGERAGRVGAGRRRAAELTWAATAEATVSVYREIAR
jgi:glycosyltransferase involved in cell wall biosynthesis